MHRHFIITTLSAILALGIVACGSSGGGGDAAAPPSGGTTTDLYTWSGEDPLVTIPAQPTAIVDTTASMRIKCVSKSLVTSPVRLLVAVDGINRIDKSVTMTLLIAKNPPTFPNNIYVYNLSENLGIIATGPSRSIAVTIDANNIYTAPGPFNIKFFTLTISVLPSFAG